MRMTLAAMLMATPILASSGAALAADLRGPGLDVPHGRGRYGGPSYGDLWRRSDPVRPDPFRPERRVMGGPDYVGSDYGLGKPSYYGIGPRPDWGRSTYD